MRFLSSDRACARASDREAARRPAGMPANHWSAHSALDIVGALTEVRVGGAGPDRNPYAPRAPPASGSSPSDPAQDENRSRPKRKWRSGRIVPPRAPPHRGQNRAIMRMSSSASEMPARTILPERHNAERRTRSTGRAGPAGGLSGELGVVVGVGQRGARRRRLGDDHEELGVGTGVFELADDQLERLLLLEPGE